MKQLVFIMFFSLLILGDIKGQQVESTNSIYYNGDTYRIFKIPITNDVISKFDIIENQQLLPHNTFITNTIKDNYFFLINASISDSSCKPIGYYVKNSTTIKPLDLGNGNGNFYLKPNGALLFTNNDIVICESSKVTGYTNVRLGIQSGPLLLENGNVNPQFNANSKNKNYRCGVGIYKNSSNEKFLVFCVSNNPVTFFNFSKFFLEKMKCQNALCLESGNCLINLPYIISGDEISTNVICNYLYYPIK